MTTTMTTPVTLDEANEILADLKFWPFGTAHPGTFTVEEHGSEIDGPALVLSRYGYDSTSWDFDDDGDFMSEGNEALELHTQEFRCNLRPEDLDDRESLLARTAYLVAYAMAHEGLEWLRTLDGEYVYDPHAVGDVQISLPGGGS